MKKILFVTQQLACGGVEKALVNLLNLVDKKCYDCELLVIDDSGEFRDFFPEWLVIREYQCPDYIKDMANYYKKPVFSNKDSVTTKIKKLFWSVIHQLNRVSVKVFKKNISYRLIFEKYRKNNDFSEYDMIVDFHGYGVFTTYLTAYQKTKAKKVSWIHEENIYGGYKYISCCYKYFDHIFGNCLDSCNNFVDKFRWCKNKVSVYYNYLDVDDIKAKADCKISKDVFKGAEFKIVSVGRVSEQKCFGRVIEVAKLLKDDNYNFKWIIVGDGEELEDLRRISVEKGLGRVVEFIGFSSNPYAYVEMADLYVQTSRAEGFCTTISEAIVLGKPVVSTRVGGIEEQLDGEKGGIITGHTPTEIAEGIKELIIHKDKLESIREHNEMKQMNYETEIEKLYQIV